jgi:hypothetical protein
MPDPETTTISGLFRALTVAQAWAIGGGFVALLVGAVALGMFVQSGRDDAQAEIQARALSDANSKNNELSGQVTDLKRGLGGVGEALETSDIQRQSLEGEVEFLNRYVSYLSAPGDVSKALFINLVCAMWKESEKRQVQIDRSPLNISAIEIQNGLSPDIVALLEKHGISAEILARAARPDSNVKQVNPSVSPNPFLRRTIIQPDLDAQQAKQHIQKQINGILLTKIVTFPDGLSFQVPSEIAVAVHTRLDCAPL